MRVLGEQIIPVPRQGWPQMFTRRNIMLRKTGFKVHSRSLFQAKHFVRRRDYLKYRDKVEKEGYVPLPEEKK